MSLQQSSRQLVQAARSIRHPQPSSPLTDFYTSFSKLCLCHTRFYHASPSSRAAAKPLSLTTKSTAKDVKELKDKIMTPEQRREIAAKRAKEKVKADQEKAMAQSQKLGSLAGNSLFAEDEHSGQQIGSKEPDQEEVEKPRDTSLAKRDFSNMAIAINPRPNARARWQRRMVIRDIRHRGRISKSMHIARTERSHLSRSHFFKTSMKKLAPLARQIAGKSIDEAILQMRFSAKKAAIDVRQHLITARNEAIVARGMGLPDPAKASTAASAKSDPSIVPALPTQTASKLLREGVKRNKTDIYIAEAWTNRGPYGREPDYRAKGRAFMMRPPYTGLSVLLKEEKTRTRETTEKEAKAIRKRIGKNMWTQLPDRPIVRQSQQVLW